MPPLLRRYRECFYCGTKSNQKQNTKIRQWQCTSCEAVNYLDENGQITDPPASSASTTPSNTGGRYAHQPIRGRSPDLSPQESDIFCRTCITNQHFYTQTLASYLPPSTDPEYPNYLAKLDEYKANLERRYPQVCAECAPKVNERMRVTNKAARADHLRRKLEQSKVQKFVDWRKWGWRRIVVFAGGVAWSASLLGQMEWHLLGLIPSAPMQEDAVYRNWFSKQMCAYNGLMATETQQNCLVAAQDLAWTGLTFGLLSCWWNFKLAEKLYSHGRLRGVGEHLALQLIVLAIRAAALWILSDAGSQLAIGIPTNAAHGMMLILLLITTITSLRTVRLIKEPLVSFTGWEPIIAEPPTSPSKQSTYESTHLITTFPISSLARAPSAEPTPYNPDDYETDDAASITSSSMDWTPTGTSELKQINPRRQIQSTFQSPYRHTGPTPFRGTLPPAPQAPAHKARNPRALQPFVPASKEKQEKFFEKMTGNAGEGDDFGGKGRGDYLLRKPEMRDRDAEGRETGLEALFNSAFSVSDAPREISASAGQDDDTGFVPGLEFSPPKGRVLTRAKREEKGHIYEGQAVREKVLGLTIAWYLIRALSVALVVYVVNKGWGQWSEVGALLWKVLNGDDSQRTRTVEEVRIVEDQVVFGAPSHDA